MDKYKNIDKRRSRFFSAYKRVLVSSDTESTALGDCQFLAYAMIVCENEYKDCMKEPIVFLQLAGKELKYIKKFIYILMNITHTNV